MPMVIEVLFVPGCPNYPRAVERVTEILRSQAINAPIREIAVTDDSQAQALQFPGSPTVRINGRDIESTAQLCRGLACRVYAGGSGVPSIEALQRAISGAQTEKG